MAWISTNTGFVIGVGVVGVLFIFFIMISVSNITLSDKDIELYQNALFRLYDIDIACYDTTLRWWFIHTIPSEDQPAHWVYEYSNKLNVIKLSNGTVSLLNEDNVFLNQIRIDKVNLKCKSWLIK